tara:strand:- start:774 stop:1166 length:393 start_codon:yes stop_codon:yes gene_type:complete
MTIAFFPGKFQPPHIGHIITVMNIYEKYDKIIIGITKDVPQVLSQIEIKSIFESIFRPLPKIKIELVSEVITGNENVKNILPAFDILVSGNDKVIRHVTNLGIKADYLPRSEGVGYSGTEIRTLFKTGID